MGKLKKKMDKIEGDYSEMSTKLKALEKGKEKSKGGDDTAEIKKDIKNLQKEIEALKKNGVGVVGGVSVSDKGKGKGADTSNLEKQIAELQEQLSELEEKVENLEKGIISLC